jgi:hypothetical protein
LIDPRCRQLPVFSQAMGEHSNKPQLQALTTEVSDPMKSHGQGDDFEAADCGIERLAEALMAEGSCGCCVERALLFKRHRPPGPRAGRRGGGRGPRGAGAEGRARAFREGGELSPRAREATLIPD